MLSIGSHVSFTKEKQLLGSLEEALSYGSTTFMFYTGAPQNTKRYPINDELTIRALEKMKDTKIDYQKVIVHAPYIINLANSDPEKYEFSIRFLREELERVEQLGIKYLVLHPGSHVGKGITAGIYSITQALNQLLIDSNQQVTILLETMAGKGTEIGSNLEEIKEIIEKIKNKNRIGVCIDTCHLHDAGYDLTDFNQFLNFFDQIIGLSYLKCIHINDSKNICSAHKDRHENIGFGKIGFDTLLSIVHHPLLENIPKILETPYINHQYAPYRYEIEMIQSKKFDPELIEKITKSNS